MEKYRENMRQLNILQQSSTCLQKTIDMLKVTSTNSLKVTKNLLNQDIDLTLEKAIDKVSCMKSCKLGLCEQQHRQRDICPAKWCKIYRVMVVGK